MSVVVEKADPPSLSSSSFADCRMRSARAWLIESFGIATFAPSGSSLGFEYSVAYSGSGYTAVEPIGCRSSFEVTL